MPTEPTVLEAFNTAFECIYVLEYYRKWHDASPGLLLRMRRDVRQLLSAEYPSLDVDTREMALHDALYWAEFPFERCA